MTEDARQALVNLLSLCEAYNITLDYTTDDDGVHVYVDGEHVYGGFLNDSAQVSDALGEAIGRRT